MKIKNILKTLFLLLSTQYTISCSSDNESMLDRNKPEIVLNSPQDLSHYHRGENINVVGFLKDDNELQSCKIEIHYDGDGHSHQDKLLSEEHFPWDYQYVFELNSTEYQLSEVIQIPLEIETGMYHFGIYVIDSAGNQSLLWRKIEIE